MFINKLIHYGLLAIVFLLSLPLNAAAKPTEINIQHWQTQNGAKVYFVASKQIPMLDVQVVFNAGSARDGSQSGLAQLTNSMLNQGSLNHDVESIASEFENRGAQIALNTTRDSASVSLRTLVEPGMLKHNVDLFAEIINHPTFPATAFERRKRNIIADINQQLQTPGYVAAKTFFHLLYNGHPYAHPIAGTIKSVTKIKSPDVEEFYKQYYVAKNAIIVLVGDINQQQARDIANKIVGSLPTGITATALTPIKNITQPKIKTIDFPSVQTHIIIGQIAINHHSPEYFPLLVGNYILGGSPLISRLFYAVREQHGYVYSVGSYFLPMCDDGPFVISLQTKSSQAQQALQLTRQTFLTFVKQGPNQQELAAAKKGIIGGFPLKLDSNAAITAQVAAIGFYNLPLDYLNTYRNKIAAVDFQAVKNAFNNVIQPQHLVTVTVGKHAKA